MRNWIHAVSVALILLASASSAVAQTAAQKQKLTIEQLIDIKHPSDPIWLPDGKLVAFVWDRAGVANLYVANADGSGQPKPLTSFSEGQVNGAFWSADGRGAPLEIKFQGCGIWPPGHPAEIQVEDVKD
jgi:hypothetical protein